MEVQINQAALYLCTSVFVTCVSGHGGVYMRATRWCGPPLSNGQLPRTFNHEA